MAATLGRRRIGRRWRARSGRGVAGRAGRTRVDQSVGRRQLRQQRATLVGIRTGGDLLGQQQFQSLALAEAQIGQVELACRRSTEIQVDMIDFLVITVMI